MINMEQIKKLAMDGDADAQFNLGDMYMFGKNVSQDYEESFKWFSKAAEHGHPKALYYLAMAYAMAVIIPSMEKS